MRDKFLGRNDLPVLDSYDPDWKDAYDQASSPAEREIAFNAQFRTILDYWQYRESALRAQAEDIGVPLLINVPRLTASDDFRHVDSLVRPYQAHLAEAVHVRELRTHLVGRSSELWGFADDLPVGCQRTKGILRYLSEEGAEDYDDTGRLIANRYGIIVDVDMRIPHSPKMMACVCDLPRSGSLPVHSVVLDLRYQLYQRYAVPHGVACERDMTLLVFVPPQCESEECRCHGEYLHMIHPHPQPSGGKGQLFVHNIATIPDVIFDLPLAVAHTRNMLDLTKPGDVDFADSSCSAPRFQRQKPPATRSRTTSSGSTLRLV